MRIRMQKLNMVKYADSEGRVKELEKQGYLRSPARRDGKDKKGEENKKGSAADG